MDIDQLVARLESMKQLTLPGMNAHDAILPNLAKQRVEAFKQDENPRLSGVAATIFPIEGKANFLLIKRQAYEGVHSAQVGFPGGKKEEDDLDLKMTALREMEEEVGIDRSVPLYVRDLSKVYIPPSRFLVHPYLFVLDHTPKMVPDPREVSEIIYFPVERLLDHRTIVEGSIRMSNGVHLKTPYFDHEGHQIWGATAMMLSELKSMLTEVL